MSRLHWLFALVLLVGCGAAAMSRQGAGRTAAAGPSDSGRMAPASDSAKAATHNRTPPPERSGGPAVKPVAPVVKPKPLGPLRRFTRKEWRRIRSVQRFVDRAAKRYGLSPSLINGVIWVESKFERRVRSRKGPRGLMQLMPRTARAMARKLRRRYMPHSADFNITVGTHYLSMMLDWFQSDLHLALAAYNRGPGHIKAWQASGSPPPKPRWAYVSRVLRAARQFCVRLKKSRYERRQGVFVCPGLQAQDDSVATR